MGRFSALPTAAITQDSAVGGQIIQGSLIFDDDHSTFFHRDMVGGNRRTWTLSYWTKLLDVNLKNQFEIFHLQSKSDNAKYLTNKIDGTDNLSADSKDHFYHPRIQKI